jgi:hypothetical protein
MMSCRKAKQVDLVDYLQRLGYVPQKIYNQNYWYFSPFRDEKEPSFKVHRNLNVWFDHGEGFGGTIIDFGIRYYRCSVTEFLQKLHKESEVLNRNCSSIAQRENISMRGKVMIADCRAIADPRLREYLHIRNIPLQIANRFCLEVEFELYKKKRLAIGFKNDAGGYELRAGDFKGSSSPKNITCIKNDPQKVCVFEGFFDFLSFQTAFLSDKENVHRLPKDQESYIVLNSLTFLESHRKLFDQYEHISLYFDRDNAGMRATRRALSWSEKYRDKSILYGGFKDMNDFHVASGINV